LKGLKVMRQPRILHPAVRKIAWDDVVRIVAIVFFQGEVHWLAYTKFHVFLCKRFTRYPTVVEFAP
jgi:hypothetical protein